MRIDAFSRRGVNLIYTGEDVLRVSMCGKDQDYEQEEDEKEEKGKGEGTRVAEQSREDERDSRWKTTIAKVDIKRWRDKERKDEQVRELRMNG